MRCACMPRVSACISEQRARGGGTHTSQPWDNIPRKQRAWQARQADCMCRKSINTGVLIHQHKNARHDAAAMRVPAACMHGHARIAAHSDALACGTQRTCQQRRWHGLCASARLLRSSSHIIRQALPRTVATVAGAPGASGINLAAIGSPIALTFSNPAAMPWPTASRPCLIESISAGDGAAEATAGTCAGEEQHERAREERMLLEPVPLVVALSCPVWSPPPAQVTPRVAPKTLSLSRHTTSLTASKV